MSLWRPRSVRQLVLVSFFTALAPLSIAILFTVQTITDLSENHRDMTRRVVDLTRSGDEIRWKLQEMERLVRTYRALDDPELPGEFESGKMETLFKQKREELVSTLSEMQASIDSSSPDISALIGSIESLSLAAPELKDSVETGAADNHRIDHTFSLFYTLVNAMKMWLAAAVDQLMEENSR